MRNIFAGIAVSITVFFNANAQSGDLPQINAQIDSVSAHKLLTVTCTKHDYYAGKLLDKVSSLTTINEFNASRQITGNASTRWIELWLPGLPEYDKRGAITKEVDGTVRMSPGIIRAWEYSASGDLMEFKVVRPDGKCCHYP
jgi:hypothetical protein